MTPEQIITGLNQLISDYMGDVPDDREILEEARDFIRASIATAPVPPADTQEALDAKGLLDRLERASMAYERLGKVAKDDAKTRAIRKDMIAELHDARSTLLAALATTRAPGEGEPGSRGGEVEIDENALEDAAKAAFVKAQSVYRADHDHFPLKSTWETTLESVREGWRSVAYAAVEAAVMPPIGTQPEPRNRRTLYTAPPADPIDGPIQTYPYSGAVGGSSLISDPADRVTTSSGGREAEASPPLATTRAPGEGEAVAWRYRHSEKEKWYFGAEAKSWWECQALYGAPSYRGQDPAIWLTRGIRPDCNPLPSTFRESHVGQLEPSYEGGPANRLWWSEAFPVYTAPPALTSPSYAQPDPSDAMVEADGINVDDAFFAWWREKWGGTDNTTMGAAHAAWSAGHRRAALAQTAPGTAQPAPRADLVEAARIGWEHGRNSWCPEGVLADKDRTERDWLRAKSEIAEAIAALSEAPREAEG